MHNNPFLYEGRGKALRQVTGATGNTLTAPDTTTIANNGYSELIAAHDCLELIFLFVFGAAATGSVVIEEVPDQTATGTSNTFDTVTVTAATSANWNAGQAMTGFYRIKNTSGQNVTVYCQKRIN
jgi:hypothetical protein